MHSVNLTFCGWFLRLTCKAAKAISASSTPRRSRKDTSPQCWRPPRRKTAKKPRNQLHSLKQSWKWTSSTPPGRPFSSTKGVLVSFHACWRGGYLLLFVAGKSQIPHMDFQVYRCGTVAACPGGKPGSCSGGLTNTPCAQCRPGPLGILTPPMSSVQDHYISHLGS